jgi:serine/threonine protein kinase
VIGTKVGRYRVTGRLGVGGGGIVYEAEDPLLGRLVALKFLPPELAADPDAVRRFTREAQTIAVLNHPHICTLHDIGEDRGRVFIAMERLEGTNLKVVMARRRLETAEIVGMSVQVTDALGAAHANGIVHRDIKPGNLFVSESGKVKVLDFGIARRFRDEQGRLDLAGSTMPGRPIGTPNYMAPERILQRPLDPRCDLFSLGVVIYEMATGRLPFAGASPGETVTNILEHDPPPLTALAPDRAAALERVVSMLLAKEPAARHQTADQLRDDLLRVERRRKLPGNALLTRVLTRFTSRP